MRHTIIFTLSLLLFVGCSPKLYEQSTYDSDDMYGVHSPKQIALKQEARQQLREQRIAQWAEALGYDTAESSLMNSAAYQTPYGERLLALSAESYSRPSSYYALSYDRSVLEQLAEYDPAKYTAVVDDLGNVTVEPKYVSSMYGSWSAVPYYGATWGYYPMSFYDYYPSRGWYDWNYGISYNYRPLYDPWWGYSPYYSYGWHRPPYYRPRPQSSYRKPTIVRRANPYVAPSGRPSGRTTVNYNNGSSVGRSSSSSYNRGTTTRSSVTRTTTTPSRVSAPSSSRSTNSFGR